MDYLKLCHLYQDLESTSKRLIKTYHLAEFLKKTSDEDLPHIILLLRGRVFPVWDPRDMGVASKLIIRAISKATGFTTAEINDEWRETGDIGTVAKKLVRKKSQATLFQKKLTVKHVFRNLQKLASLEGQGTIEQKINIIAELLTSSSPEEAKYIVRTVLNDLRVGVGDGGIRDAIVWSSFNVNYNDRGIIWKNEPEERQEYNKLVDAVQHAYDLLNDFSEVAVLGRKGLKKLLQVHIRVGQPLNPMLAIKSKDIEDAFKSVGKPAQFEFKYDGIRMQIHKNNDSIKIFTRNLEEVTKQFPEVVDIVEKIQAKSFILDAEAVGYDPKTKKYLPFQKISQRVKRKYEIQKMARDFPVELNVFDVVYVDGKDLLSAEFKERRKIVEKIIPRIKNKVSVAEKIVTGKIAEAKKFYDKALKLGNEGLMAKKLDAPYKPGARVGYMVKIKPTMETLDLVIVGAEWGEGKRANWLTSFTLACSKGDELVEVGKVGTGIKEKGAEGVTFTEMTDILKPLIKHQKGKEVTLKPKLVIEIKYEEIQKSPTYSSGYALRFPRVVRIREDKGLNDIATLNEVKKLYEGQRS